MTPLTPELRGIFSKALIESAHQLAVAESLAMQAGETTTAAQLRLVLLVLHGVPTYDVRSSSPEETACVQHYSD
jgi:hypothetical protein